MSLKNRLLAFSVSFLDLLNSTAHPSPPTIRACTVICKNAVCRQMFVWNLPADSKCRVTRLPCILKGALYTGHLPYITLYLPFICLKALYFWEKMVNNESFSLIYFGISWTSKRMELVPLLYLPMPPLFMILIYIDEYLLKLVQKSTLGIVFIYPHVIVQSNLWIT